jgi:hypothetical protein
VDPKQPYFESDFKDARFVWTADLALDNTVVFRTRIEKPGWTPRWNTKPDLDVRGEHQPSPRNALSFRKAEGLKLWLACQPLLRRLSAIALATADFRRTPERIELGSQF